MDSLLLFACAFMLGALNARWIPDALDDAGDWIKRRVMRAHRPDSHAIQVTPEGASWIDVALKQLERNESIGAESIERMRRETNGTRQSLKHVAKKYDEDA